MQEIYNEIISLTITDSLSWKTRTEEQDRIINEYKKQNKFYKNNNNNLVKEF
jgi:hypothetical protein